MVLAVSTVALTRCECSRGAQIWVSRGSLTCHYTRGRSMRRTPQTAVALGAKRTAELSCVSLSRVTFDRTLLRLTSRTVSVRVRNRARRSSLKLIPVPSLEDKSTVSNSQKLIGRSEITRRIPYSSNLSLEREDHTVLLQTMGDVADVFNVSFDFHRGLRW